LSLKILASSDFHGFLPDVPECDLFLIAGDICPVWNHNRQVQAMWMRSDFQEWLARVPAEKIIGIAGNHDFITQDANGFGHGIRGWTYLEDQTYEYEGLVIHGTPWTPQFGNWAWMQPDPLLNYKWDLIPDETDILLVHGPPYGILDEVMGAGNAQPDGTFQKSVGSKTLLNHVEDRLTNLKAVVFGHIHEAYGKMETNGFNAYNVSRVDLNYDPNNAIVEIQV
jgi:Icc-related predicted phosphoesterase